MRSPLDQILGRLFKIDPRRCDRPVTPGGPPGSSIIRSFERNILATGVTTFRDISHGERLLEHVVVNTKDSSPGSEIELVPARESGSIRWSTIFKSRGTTERTTGDGWIETPLHLDATG